MDKDPFGKVGQDPPRIQAPEEAGRKAAKAEPYDGQIFCPVSGKKLGVEQPAVPVQTSIGEEKPTGLSKLFKKAKPGMVIYACCPACADAIRRDPQMYLTQVIADKATWSFKYVNAPAQRPALAPINYNLEPKHDDEEPASAAAAPGGTRPATSR
jgi:hypothetical protein